MTMALAPVPDLVRQLQSGETTSLALVGACLDAIADPNGDGARVYLATDPEPALEAARKIDAQRETGKPLPPLAGIPVSIKALFDIKGMVTTAGSKILSHEPPAQEDAEIVGRLRAAGMIVLGHTNMTEFAYSGLGLNPHYGTPINPADPNTPRAPGGSSSGAAVSVARGMAAIAIGTDTGGSCRIPASFCGLTGFKPTAKRVPMKGTFPLSPSFDSIGPIGRTVACCALTDAILSGGSADLPTPREVSSIRLAMLDNYVNQDLSGLAARAYHDTLSTLEKAGVKIVAITLPELDRLPELNARGGIVAAEALGVHQHMLESDGDTYDPRVSVRIKKALEQSPGEYQTLLAERQTMIEAAEALTEQFDAVIFPTTPFVAPTLAELEDDNAYGRANLLALRNPTVANFLDRCAISIPMPVGDGLPVGLTLMGAHMGDRDLLATALAIEDALKVSRH